LSRAGIPFQSHDLDRKAALPSEGSLDGVVRRAVVGNDDSGWSESLAGDRGERLVQESTGVEGRDDDGNVLGPEVIIGNQETPPRQTARESYESPHRSPGSRHGAERPGHV